VQRILLLFALLLMLAGPTAADELLMNGDFEQALDVGWEDTVELSAGLYAFERSDTFGQPTPGYAAKAYKTLAYYASLRQTVDVPSADLTLSFDGRLKIGDGSSTCWPVLGQVCRRVRPRTGQHAHLPEQRLLDLGQK